MPTKPPRKCSEPSCRTKITSRSSVCPEHLRQRDRQRGTSSQRGYGGQWRKIRARFLKEHPWCEDCLAQGRITRASEIDHKIRLRDSGTNRWENLSAVCRACHSCRTAKYDGGYGNLPRKGKLG
jgi:5-methylcytosine-specific restriction protein A